MRYPISRPQGRARRRKLTGAVLALVLIGLAALLGGCTQVHVALAIQGDDTVSGDIVIGTAGAAPPKVTVPPALADRVSVRPYRDSGYVGTQMRFNGLRFDEVNSLVGVAPKADGRFRFQLRRAGGLVLVSGQADLTALPVDGADVQLKIAFSGDLVNTDGTVSGRTVSWVFPAGQVHQFNAVLAAPDPSKPSVVRWTVLVAVLVAIAAIAVVVLARADRNPPVVRSGGRL